MNVPRWIWPPGQTAHQKRWAEELTPELRASFESRGEDEIRNEVHSCRSVHENAARAWLAERRRESEKRECIVFWLIVATFIASVVGAFLAA